MPLYEYQCHDCGDFDAMRSYEQRDAALACPECGQDCTRIFATAPRMGALSSATRSAHAVNERARHEPIQSKDYQAYKHPAGCGCCSGSSKMPKATRTTKEGAKFAPNKRPWMISH